VVFFVYFPSKLYLPPQSSSTPLWELRDVKAHKQFYLRHDSALAGEPKSVRTLLLTREGRRDILGEIIERRPIGSFYEADRTVQSLDNDFNAQINQ
jgi:hypothetical protein